MSFGRLLAYESLRRTNPRAGGSRYGDSGFGRCRSVRAQRQDDALRLSADASLSVPLALDWTSSVPIETVKHSFCRVTGEQYR